MSPNRLHALRVNARELLRQPGLQKQIDLDLPASELGVDDGRITGDLSIELTATSTIDGVTVHGRVAMPWRASCRRCLVDIDGVADIEVDELYQDEVADDAEAFPIDGDQIDLAPAVREHVVLELPDDRLCRETCAGICPLCGADRNEVECDCDTTVRDERWAVLDALKFDEN